MSKYNGFFKLILFMAALSGGLSCKKSFLDETLKTARSTDFYKTDAGIQQLAVGTYYQVFDVALPIMGRMNSISAGTHRIRPGTTTIRPSIRSLRL
jgi:hypothetical protein